MLKRCRRILKMSIPKVILSPDMPGFKTCSTSDLIGRNKDDSLLLSQDISLSTYTSSLPEKEDAWWSKEELETFIQHLKWLEENKDKFSSILHRLAFINIFFSNRSLKGLLAKQSDLILRSDEHAHPHEEFIHGVSQDTFLQERSKNNRWSKEHTDKFVDGINEIHRSQKKFSNLTKALQTIYIPGRDIHAKLNKYNNLIKYSRISKLSFATFKKQTFTQLSTGDSSALQTFSISKVSSRASCSKKRKIFYPSLESVSKLSRHTYCKYTLTESDKSPVTTYIILADLDSLPSTTDSTDCNWDLPPAPLSPIQSPKKKEMTPNERSIFKGVFYTQIYTSSDQRMSLKEVCAYLVSHFFKDSDIAEMERTYWHLVKNKELPEYPKT